MACSTRCLSSHTYSHIYSMPLLHASPLTCVAMPLLLTRSLITYLLEALYSILGMLYGLLVCRRVQGLEKSRRVEGLEKSRSSWSVLE